MGFQFLLVPFQLVLNVLRGSVSVMLSDMAETNKKTRKKSFEREPIMSPL